MSASAQKKLKEKRSLAAYKGWMTRLRRARKEEDDLRRRMNQADGYYSPAFFKRSLGH